MQPLLSDADLAELTGGTELKEAPIPVYGEDKFFAEIALMIEVDKARTLMEFGSNALEPLSGIVTIMPYGVEGADLFASYEALAYVAPDKLDETLAHFAEMTKRHALLVVPLKGWAAPELEQEFWATKIGAHLQLSSIERVGKTLVIFAHHKDLIAEMKIKGVMGDDGQKARAIQASCARGLPFLKEEEPHEKVLHVCGFGPSLADTIELARGADILSTSGAHTLILARGMLPKFHAESDPRPERATFGTPSHLVRYLIASCCHADLFAKLDGFDVELWHSYSGAEDEKLQFSLGGLVLHGGSNTGLCGLALGYARGYRKFEVHGMDCSYRDGARHAGAHPGKEQKSIKVRVGDPVKGQEFYTSGQMLAGARELRMFLLRAPDCQIKVHGDGLLPAMLEWDRLNNSKAA